MRMMKNAQHFTDVKGLLEKSFAVILGSIRDEESFSKARSFAVAQDDKISDLGIDDYIAAISGCSYEQ